MSFKTVYAIALALFTVALPLGWQAYLHFEQKEEARRTAPDAIRVIPDNPTELAKFRKRMAERKTNAVENSDMTIPKYPGNTR